MKNYYVALVFGLIYNINEFNVEKLIYDAGTIRYCSKGNTVN